MGFANGRTARKKVGRIKREPDIVISIARCAREIYDFSVARLH
jgi:hypothetical protein